MKKKPLPIILASTSPSRAEILQGAGIPFIVEASRYIEDMSISKNPLTIVRTFSRGKARDVASRHPHIIVIGADTIGLLQGKILGKPTSKTDARRMLQDLSGKTHLSVTGVTVINTSSHREITKVVKTEVGFRTLSSRDIENYLATREWEEKAAAYAIQGKGRVLVQYIKGEYYNVCGLPIATLVEMLEAIR